MECFLKFEMDFWYPIVAAVVIYVANYVVRLKGFPGFSSLDSGL